MGIHIRCPNGHELNVKSHLAGKRGVCPHCGARFQIPGHSHQDSHPYVDPIAESPESLWHVRPPSGEQYGPADAATIERWLAEGRVPADALVWRQGWPEWRTAASTFHQLRSADSTPNVSAQLPSEADPPLERPVPATPDAVPEEIAGQPPKDSEDRVVSRPIRGSTRTKHRKRGRHRVALKVLLLAVAALVPIAWYVITRS